MSVGFRVALIFTLSLLILPASAGPQSQGSPFSSSSNDWPIVGGNISNNRYSPLSQINLENVDKLSGAWLSAPFEDGASSRVSPVISDGLMYVTAGMKVYALNASTGEKVWTYQTVAGKPPDPADLRNFLRYEQVPNSQGVAVGEGMVFVGLTGGSVLALDAKTGKLIWQQVVSDDKRNRVQTASAAPVFANGSLFWSATTVERGVGQAVCLDAKTGRILWRFRVVPGPGEPGFETWPKDNDSWKNGGGNIWLPPAVDPVLGLVFYGTGNAVPVKGGEVRAGNNLHTVSAIALEMKTGKLRWHYQLVHHDLWDLDVAVPLILYESNVSGRNRKGVAAMRADGYLFLLDRETGKPLIPIEERPVPQSKLSRTALTQPFLVSGDNIGPRIDCENLKPKVPAGFVLSCDPFVPPSVDSLNVLAMASSSRVQPMSFSPQTGYFYAQGRTGGVGWNRRPDDPYFFSASSGARVPGLGRISPSTSFVAAIDSQTSKVVWRKEVPTAGGFGSGGFLSSAGGLLFHRKGDGNLQAFNAKTGALRWQYQTGYTGRDATPVTYEVGGHQFLAIIEGNRVRAFRLGGTIGPATAPKVVKREEEPALISGPIEDTQLIELASLLQENMYYSGKRIETDEYAFNPYRARVKVGVPVNFGNNGKKTHTLTAQDGSWTTGPIQPNEATSITFSKPGTYIYSCKEHPFSYGEILVVEDSKTPVVATAPPGTTQLQRGKAAYEQNCSACHMPDLSGNGKETASLVGRDFLARWNNQSAADLFDRMRTTMPTTSPGSLSPEAYLTITAYILQANELGSAKEDLSKESLATVPLKK